MLSVFESTKIRFFPPFSNFIKMNITATLINLYHVCHRELWLHANEIRMEHTSDIVAEGKLIGDNAYPQRSERYTELAFDGVKIDFDKEWVHLRRSNTEPIIRIYSESESESTANNLANKIITDIRELIKEQQA